MRTRSSEKAAHVFRAAPSAQRRARSRLVSREPTRVPSSVRSRVLPSRTRVEPPPLRRLSRPRPRRGPTRDSGTRSIFFATAFSQCVASDRICGRLAVSFKVSCDAWQSQKINVRGIFPRHVLKRHPRIHNSGFAPDSSRGAFLSEPLEARQRALGSRRAAYTHARVLFSPRGTPRSRWRSCRSRPRAASRARARDLDPRLARGFVPDPLVRGFVAPPREKHPADRSRLRSPPRSAGRRASRG